MKTMTLKEGILRTLDGAEVTIMVPTDILSMTMEDLTNMKELGAYCVYTEELHAAEQEPPKEAEKEEKKPAAAPRVDSGKIRALANAGWNVQKIAEEMGISAPTVRRYLKED